MKYKALVFDLDGTAIPKRPDGMPSAVVIDAVNRAKEVCHVSVATGRPLEIARDVLDALSIDDLCILNGGTQIYSRKSEEFIWKQEIDTLTLQELFGRFQQFSQYMVADEKRLPRVPMAEYLTHEPVGLSCVFSATLEDAQKMLEIVAEFPGITAQAVSSWKDGTFDVHISNQMATKKHALQTVMDRLGVDCNQVMVAGDGGNDLPLFELAGWRVAMGNASDDLKAKADWIAPDVSEDGLATAIQRFILEES